MTIEQLLTRNLHEVFGEGEGEDAEDAAEF